MQYVPDYSRFFILANAIRKIATKAFATSLPSLLKGFTIYDSEVEVLK